MKTRYTVLLSMIAGAAIGGVAIQGLHAQAKPPVYLITEIDVKDPDKYGAEFAPKAQATIRGAGAKFIVIGGTAEPEQSPYRHSMARHRSESPFKHGRAWKR
jgi:Domain of unknown function (DUF1330)